jgi:hypothetical protein
MYISLGMHHLGHLSFPVHRITYDILTRCLGHLKKHAHDSLGANGDQENLENHTRNRQDYGPDSVIGKGKVITRH